MGQEPTPVAFILRYAMVLTSLFLFFFLLLQLPIDAVLRPPPKEHRWAEKAQGCSRMNAQFLGDISRWTFSGSLRCRWNSSSLASGRHAGSSKSLDSFSQRPAQRFTSRSGRIHFSSLFGLSFQPCLWGARISSSHLPFLDFPPLFSSSPSVHAKRATRASETQ